MSKSNTRAEGRISVGAPEPLSEARLAELDQLVHAYMDSPYLAMDALAEAAPELLWEVRRLQAILREVGADMRHTPELLYPGDPEGV